jgi:hypothetical protein
MEIRGEPVILERVDPGKVLGDIGIPGHVHRFPVRWRMNPGPQQIEIVPGKE